MQTPTAPTPANAWRTRASDDATYTLALDPAAHAHLDGAAFEELVWATLPSPEGSDDEAIEAIEELEGLMLIALHKKMWL